MEVNLGKAGALPQGIRPFLAAEGHQREWLTLIYRRESGAEDIEIYHQTHLEFGLANLGEHMTRAGEVAAPGVEGDEDNAVATVPAHGIRNRNQRSHS